MTSNAAQDRLWVPLLTHYKSGAGGVALDLDRQSRHLASIKSSVRQFLVAGSTGDGWELDEESFAELLGWAAQSPAMAGCRVLFGALRPTTAGVIARATAVERHLAESGDVAALAYVGLAVCPPVLPDATQEAILQHYKSVLAQTTSPIAVYQLPQVTGCSIAPETMRTLAAEPRVTMFKDTSGTDTVAAAGGIGDVLMVRGAEGGYIDALKPQGPYDGWLLSTGNAFGPLLRRMLDLAGAGDLAQARLLSKLTAALIDYLFEAAQSVPFGNAFSNANRAADHLLAFGAGWRDAEAPLTRSGKPLPLHLLQAAEAAFSALPALSPTGYLGG